MPRCADCGNTSSFGCSEVPPASDTANGPVSGLIADFDENGYIVEMESMGASLDDAQEAWEMPEMYFDICYKCGSRNIIW